MTVFTARSYVVVFAFNHSDSDHSDCLQRLHSSFIIKVKLNSSKVSILCPMNTKAACYLRPGSCSKYTWTLQRPHLLILSEHKPQPFTDSPPVDFREHHVLQIKEALLYASERLLKFVWINFRREWFYPHVMWLCPEAELLYEIRWRFYFANMPKKLERYLAKRRASIRGFTWTEFWEKKERRITKRERLVNGKHRC